MGGVEQIRVGKKYTHNDICFPCQMVIGELIDALQKGNYPEDSVAVGMAKLSCDCRMANYTAILRKALDSAGFENVPILTTDPGDTKGIHPGVSMLGARSVLLAAWAFSMLDILEELCRKIRPYETAAGETNRVFSECVEWIAAASKQGLGKMIGAFRRAIEAFRGLRYDRSRRKPRVLVTGELLVNFHPGTNFHVEEYLERNDMEVILPRITYQFRKDFQAAISEIRDFGAHLAPYPFALDGAVEFIQRFLERIARSHPLYHPAARPQDLYSDVEHFIPKTLTCGEGWLMAGEIAHYAHQGVRSFIILQPFGCLPNHVCGRGVTKRLKEEFPGVQILPLDLDPDTSYANVENRLQMLIMNQTAEAEHSAASVEPAPQKTRGGSPRPALSSTSARASAVFSDSGEDCPVPRVDLDTKKAAVHANGCLLEFSGIGNLGHFWRRGPVGGHFARAGGVRALLWTVESSSRTCSRERRGGSVLYKLRSTSSTRMLYRACMGASSASRRGPPARRSRYSRGVSWL